jgi:hypothetical protein
MHPESTTLQVLYLAWFLGLITITYKHPRLLIPRWGVRSRARYMTDGLQRVHMPGGIASWVILKSYALICHWTLLFNMVELAECEAKAWKDGFTRIVLIYLRYLIGRMIVVESQLLYLN